MNQFGPVQFDFQKLWFHSRREFMAKEPVLRELAGIRMRWLDIAQFKYDENSSHDEELAREELALDIHIGQVKIKDLHWLRSQFENHDLSGLSLAIAQAVMPENNWEVIEGNGHAVITDAGRSIVFDMKNGTALSAGGSLLVAGDQKYQPTQSVLEEVVAWQERRFDCNRDLLCTIQGHLDRCRLPGVVVDMRRPSRT